VATEILQASLLLDPRARREALYRIHSALRSADNLRPDEAFDELAELYEVWVAEGPLTLGALARRHGVQASEAALQRVVPQLWDLLGDKTAPLGADLFQELADVGVRSGLGQYFTPAPAARAMAAFLAPKSGESWMDPFAGSALLLGEIARAAGGEVSLFATDVDQRVLRLARIEAELRHPDSPLSIANISCLGDPADVLAAVGADPEGVDGVVTNPPFGALDLRGDAMRHGFELVANGATPIELLGLEQSLRLLRPGGRMGIVLPQSVFSNKRMAYVRQFLATRFSIDAVLSLPPETFALFRGVGKASILFVTKAPPSAQREVWFGVPSSAGWDATGREAGREDIVETATAMRRHEAVVGRTEGRESPEVGRNLTAEWHLRSRSSGVPIGELAEIVFTGKTPARSDYCEPDGSPDIFRAVKVANLTGAGLDWTTGERAFARFKSAAVDKRLRQGDVVMTAAAHHPRYIAAKVDLVDVLPEGWEKRCIPSGELLVIRVRTEAIDPRLLLLWLRTDEGRGALQACITGQTAHLHPEYVKDVTVPTRILELDFGEAADLLSQALARRRESEHLAAAACDAFDLQYQDKAAVPESVRLNRR
jgi:type I restriction enzyme M protein